MKMAIFQKNFLRSADGDELDDQECNVLEPYNRSSKPLHSPKGHGDNDRHQRRKIANCNERRRMQSINTGFAGLRDLLPVMDVEKLSKAAILQQTSEYARQLIKDCANMEQRNQQLRDFIKQHCHPGPAVADILEKTAPDIFKHASPPPDIKRPRIEFSSKQEAMSYSRGPSNILLSREGVPQPAQIISLPLHGMTNSAPSVGVITQLQQELYNLRHQLQQEQQARVTLEDQIRGVSTGEYQLISQPSTEPSGDSLHSVDSYHDNSIPMIQVNQCTEIPTPGSCAQEQVFVPISSVLQHGSAPHLPSEISSSPSEQVMGDQNPQVEICTTFSQQGLLRQGGHLESDVDPSQGSSTVSQRNLQIILTAIQHLESNDNAPQTLHLPNENTTVTLEMVPISEVPLTSSWPASSSASWAVASSSNWQSSGISWASAGPSSSVSAMLPALAVTELPIISDDSNRSER